MVRELKHTEIGDIPVDWELQTFDETFRVLSNNTLSRKNLNNRGGAVRNIHYGDILTKFPEVLDCDEEEIPYVNDLSLLSSSTQLLQDGDIVIADTAEDETVGKVTEVQNLGDSKLVAGLHTIPCRVKKGDFASGWLGYYMNSNLFHNQILPYITGIKVSSISKGAISEILIVVPPFDEQEKIVQSLNEVQSLMTAETKVVNKIKFVKNGCLSKMFPQKGDTVPEMRLPGFTDAWEQRKLGDEAIEMLAGGDIDKSKIVENGKYPIYANALTNDGIVGYYDDYYRVKAPAVTVTGRGDVGHAQARTVDFTPVVRLLAIRSEHDVYFLKNAINNHGVIVESTGVPQLTVPQLGNYMIQFPRTIEEETKIGDYFRNLDHLITLHQCKCDKYASIKKGMMSDLLTGKIRLV
ncbi:MAG: restriction endonuclease subunit S [Lachnospiraceae bacterium]|nr:restriction endonuclease subunit S [Lachnospiraceae bacterium]